MPAKRIPTWGDSVRLTRPSSSRETGSLASVCGIRTIETREEAERARASVGTILYTIEFGDGSDIDVPESWIELVDK